MLMDTTNGKYILSKTKKCLLSVASNHLLMLLYFCTEFPEIRRENVLCVAGCYRHDIAANSQHQNRGKFALCVSRHLLGIGFGNQMVAD